MRRQYTLVIVDMQKRFEAHEAALPGCLEIIKQAKLDGSPIVVLEFEGSGKTIEAIMNEIGEHPFSIMQKRRDDGSDSVLLACHKNGFPKSKFIVGGVNSEYCVYKTVKGLVSKISREYKKPRIKVMRKAISSCWASYNNNEKISELYGQLENVVLN